MKTTHKSILAVLVMCLIVLTTTGATLAYLTDTDADVNTFTVGQVGITLDEAEVNPDGSYKTNKDNRVKENEYHLLPGHTYIKDPTIHVDDDSEDCYLFVEVLNGIADIEGGEETIAQQMARQGWTSVEGVDNVYVLAQGDAKRAVSKREEVVVFEKFTIDGDNVVNDPDDASEPTGGESQPTEATTASGERILSAYADKEIRVIAYAVQKAGFENTAPEEIWAVTFGKTTANP